MKILKTVLLVLLCLVLAVSPIVIPLVGVMVMPPQYEHTYLGALDEKFERLNSITDPKIILVGGSSVAFGVDSEKLEEYTGMPVVNFGLYAALGTKLMLDLSRSGINKGDIVIISPEMNSQTMSLYFSSSSTYKAVDCDYSMLNYVKAADKFKMLGGAWDFFLEKLEFYKKQKQGYADGQDGIYRSSYFDQYGDFDYPREENVMHGYYDRNTPVRLNDTIFDEDYCEFVEYLNEYIAYARLKGAEVYFDYCPINELALLDSNSDSIEKVDRKIRADIKCRVIGALDKAVMEAGYFFDTNFHLNDAGRVAKTVLLARNIRLAYGITEGIITTEIPEAPELPFDPYFDGEDENAEYFLFEEVEGTYTIVGLSEKGRKKQELTVPLGYEGLKVTAIAKGAFKSSNLKSLTVTVDSNLRTIGNGAFEGATALSHLWIYKTTGDDITPPTSFFGVSRDFVVHVPEGSDFAHHYFWSERGVKFVFDAK